MKIYDLVIKSLVKVIEYDYDGLILEIWDWHQNEKLNFSPANIKKGVVQMLFPKKF